MVEGRRERRIQSIEVGFLLIKVLEAADGPLQLSTLAARAGMPASKAYTYLVSFAREGLVAQDPATGLYGLGTFAFQLGLSAIRQVDVVAVAPPEVAALSSATDFACFVCVWGNRGPVIAVKADGTYQGALAVRIGYVFPLRTAVGYAFLTWRDEPDMAGLIAEQKLHDDAQFDADIKKIRKNGYSTTPLSSPVMLEGFVSVAAPVFDYSGQIAATISILGPSRMFKSRLHLQALKDSASRLSAKIGGAHAAPEVSSR
ncbi:IclR family transcriptional regulator [Paraburkholderia sartisoli]|uniref:DNA-binding transcriptional regulator, IclR family n=1 Tax=Paraburkholderia sartisoli TaxID=83784 RepID=A0A1H4GRS7_9BURK|nr:IclR family transcriptional regulator [Paraburkholderia sartisoli]SEB12234.1 DNA-binding transcriptional regulator, IclR family [Paraburkholderia sartisoli]